MPDLPGDTPAGDTPAADSGSTWGQQALRSSMGAGTASDGAEPDGSAAPLDPGAGSGTPIGGGRSAPSDRRPAGPRPIRGPRFSGGPFIAGLGLLSLLVVIAIMAIVVVKVIDGTRGTTVTDVVGPASIGGGTAPDGGPQTGASGGEESGALDAATLAACRIDKQTMETAVSVYEAMEGEPPASIEDLITASLLREDPGGFELRPGPDGIEVVGVGRCEGTP